MAELRCFAFLRCASHDEIAIELQRKKVQEYCEAMNYDLFSEITTDLPCDEAQAKAICQVYRKEIGLTGPLKMIVLNMHRISRHLHMVQKVVEVFKSYEIEVESTSPNDNGLLAITEEDELALFKALMDIPSGEI